MFLGIDVGTSSIKVAILDPASGRMVGSASSPEVELPIQSPQPGFAEQDPRDWWEHTQRAIAKLPREQLRAVQGIGIGYQMHGLVLLDSSSEPTRPAILWCDSRAAIIGSEAFSKNSTYCREHLLNSPGNFTAAKLAWVRQHQPEIYKRSRHAVLPGDYIALKLTGEVRTTFGGLSEMALWDFQSKSLAEPLLETLGLDASYFPEAGPACGIQGHLTTSVAEALGLAPGIPIACRAGDQPTNALSLGALEPGEVAATAGTSGVVFAVNDQAVFDADQRTNVFLHVGTTAEAPHGVLCCVNGCGAMLAWVRNEVLGRAVTYDELNALAAKAPVGSDGLRVYPYGNGAERILGDREPGAVLSQIDFRRHGLAHLCRATQEGIAFALRFGVANQPRPSLVRASTGNLFQSPVFAQSMADLLQCPVEVRETQGVLGAAWGAAMGMGVVERPKLAEAAARYEPGPTAEPLLRAYEEWVNLGLSVLGQR